MQLTNWFTALALPILAAETVLGVSLPLRIIQYNIRYATSSLETNEKSWDSILCLFNSNNCRKEHVIAQVSAQAAESATTVIGMQEVLDDQLSDIKSGLGSQWAHIGVARDDGKKSGEYSPILYRADVLKVLYSETKWLSPTPDVVSYGWGAGSRRVVTLGVFEHIATGKQFIHANTHLDNVASEARVEGIKVVVARIQAAQAAYGPLAVSLTGDFNADPNDAAYKTLVGLSYMEDLWSVATHVGANQLTYTGFDLPVTGISRIDFIWLGPTNENVNSYFVSTGMTQETLDNYVDDIFHSDHRMVVGDVTLV